MREFRSGGVLTGHPSRAISRPGHGCRDRDETAKACRRGERSNDADTAHSWAGPGNGELFDHPVSHEFATMLPLTLAFADFNKVERVARLARPLALRGVPDADQPRPDEIGYYAPAQSLVLYYSHVGRWPGLVRMGSFAYYRDALRALLDGVAVHVAAVTHRGTGERWPGIANGLPSPTARDGDLVIASVHRRSPAAASPCACTKTGRPVLGAQLWKSITGQGTGERRSIGPRVLISVDMEGLQAPSIPSETTPERNVHERGRRLMTAAANAVVSA
ncbi:cyclophilin-like fold protein [Nonomuraea sp. SYSU D8015]|uniref:cyclophilin-like fold protein n=1 Tax=Nonomuraea sp. SYSU D8015 TaxID=2593644 RepID=UPI001CB71200|nr:cyclophilin-like fold protein [Nonomuraea sp. SYSU D8015]